MPRRFALVGVFAVLLQAVLFGWHTHPLRFGDDGRWPVVSSTGNGAPLSPIAADDDCELCLALHHLTAAPGEFILPVLSSSTVSLAAAIPAVRLARSPWPRFRARAPPLA